MLDNQVISSPQVDPSVNCDVGITGGSTQITGTFTAEEAKNLAALVRGGALPVPIEVIEQRAVGPTLGAAAIDSSAKVAVIGVALTALFLTIIYRLLGALAVLALVSHALLSYATLVSLGATLTLPGLAGFVLAIGVLASMVSALVITRVLADWAVRRRAVIERPAITGIAAIGRVRTWLTARDPDLMRRGRRPRTLASRGLLSRTAARTTSRSVPAP